MQFSQSLVLALALLPSASGFAPAPAARAVRAASVARSAVDEACLDTALSNLLMDDPDGEKPEAPAAAASEPTAAAPVNGIVTDAMVYEGQQAEFAAWKSEFGKSYGSSADEATAFANFVENSALSKRMNAILKEPATRPNANADKPLQQLAQLERACVALRTHTSTLGAAFGVVPEIGAVGAGVAPADENARGSSAGAAAGAAERADAAADVPPPPPAQPTSADGSAVGEATREATSLQ